MSIAEILAWLLLFAGLTAAIGAGYALHHRKSPVAGAVSGLLAYMVSLGLLAVPALVVVAVQEWWP